MWCSGKHWLSQKTRTGKVTNRLSKSYAYMHELSQSEAIRDRRCKHEYMQQHCKIIAMISLGIESKYPDLDLSFLDSWILVRRNTRCCIYNMPVKNAKGHDKNKFNNQI